MTASTQLRYRRIASKSALDRSRKDMVSNLLFLTDLDSRKVANIHRLLGLSCGWSGGRICIESRSACICRHCQRSGPENNGRILAFRTHHRWWHDPRLRGSCHKVRLGFEKIHLEGL